MGEQKEKKGNGEKKSDRKKKGETLVEFKLDLHCEGRALKDKKFVNGLQGVEGAKPDVATYRLKITGKVDPWKIKEFLEAEAEAKVEFIFLKDPPNKSKDEGKKNKAVLALPLAAAANVAAANAAAANASAAEAAANAAAANVAAANAVAANAAAANVAAANAAAAAANTAAAAANTAAAAANAAAAVANAAAAANAAVAAANAAAAAANAAVAAANAAAAAAANSMNYNAPFRILMVQSPQMLSDKNRKYLM